MAKELSYYLANAKIRPELNVPTGTLEKPRDATRVDEIIEFLRRAQPRAFHCATANRHNI